MADGQRLDSYGLTVNFLRLTNYQGFGITNGSRRYHFADLEMSATTDKLSSSQVNGQEDRFQFNKVIVARAIVESDAAGSMLGCYGVDESVNMTQLIESFCGSMGLAMNGSQCLVETKIREVINQGGGCPDGQSFNGFNASGSAICVPRAHLIGSMGGCGGGSFVSGVDGNGSWTCGSPPAPVIPPPPVASGSCLAGQFMTGMNSSGPICAGLPAAPAINFGECPHGSVMKGFGPGGPICQSLAAEATPY